MPRRDREPSTGPRKTSCRLRRWTPNPEKRSERRELPVDGRIGILRRQIPVCQDLCGRRPHGQGISEDCPWTESWISGQTAGGRSLGKSSKTVSSRSSSVIGEDLLHVIVRFRFSQSADSAESDRFRRSSASGKTGMVCQSPFAYTLLQTLVVKMRYGKIISRQDSPG